MASKDFAVLDLQNDNEELNMDLQFQDFGSTQTKPSGGKHEQTIHFSDFPDSAEDEQDKMKPQRKKCKMIIKETVADNIDKSVNTKEVSGDDQEVVLLLGKSKKLQNETQLDITDSTVSSLSLLSNNIKISAILPQGVRGPVQLVTVVVLKILDKVFTSKAVKQLSSRVPVPSLLHLKRVRKVVQDSKEWLFVYLDICSSFGILDIKGDFGENNIKSLDEDQSKNIRLSLENKSIDMSLFSSEVYVSQVSEFPSRVRSLYESAAMYWPCSFHEDAYLAKLSSDNFFAEEDILKIVKYMNEAIMCSGSSDTPSHKAQGVVIVDDERGNIVGRGYNARSQHPLKHPAMMAVDDVSHVQGGGAWTDSHNRNIHTAAENKIKVTCQKEKVSELSETNEKKRVNRTMDTDDLRTEFPVNAECGVYICTGYDVYSTHEPCMMCAMALLHSRVRRIFFWKPYPELGALVSRTKLHTLPNINHRYEVFQIDTL